MDSEQTGAAGVPGWYAAGLAHAWLPYAQMKTMRPPLPVVRAQGCRIVLADGRSLIDGVASWWTACHGYGHPHIRAAVERQLAQMPHVMLGGLVHEPALTLARRLAALLPGELDRVFFSESGSVAVEFAMRVVMTLSARSRQVAHRCARFVRKKRAMEKQRPAHHGAGVVHLTLSRSHNRAIVPGESFVQAAAFLALTRAFRRDLYRAAAFRWITPFCAVLSISAHAFFSAS